MNGIGLEIQGLSACSVCLRVQRESGWLDARDVILAQRTFEQAAAPRLSAALCSDCRREIRARRSRPPEALAA